MLTSLRFPNPLPVIWAVLVSPLVGDTVAFFYALDADLRAIKSAGATEVRVRKIGATAIEELSLNGRKLSAVKMGSGCVRTASSAQALLATSPCSVAISVGPVGGLSPDLEVGTWLRVSEAIPYQKLMVTNEAGTAKVDPILPIDPKLEATLPVLWVEASAVRVASGEAFISEEATKTDIRSRTEAAVVDMNLFGLLTILEDHNVSGVHFRVVSDLADSNAGTAFREFEKNYDGLGGKLAAEWIASLPVDPTSPDAHPSLRALLRVQAQPADPQSPAPVPEARGDEGGRGDSPDQSGR